MCSCFGLLIGYVFTTSSSLWTLEGSFDFGILAKRSCNESLLSISGLRERKGKQHVMQMNFSHAASFCHNDRYIPVVITKRTQSPQCILSSRQ